MGRCPDRSDLIVRPSFGAWYKESAESCWRYSAMQNGIASVCDVETGKTYTVGTYYDNVWYEWDITIEEDQVYDLEFQLTEDICTTFF
jgi:hypothetical protein